MPSIKILLAYHKPFYLLQNQALTPIHVGRASTDANKDGCAADEQNRWMRAHMIGDDTGENISRQNRLYCEATSIYWAWKNYDKLDNPDYIGFMHYRRQMLLRPPKAQPNMSVLEFSSFAPDHLQKTGLDDDGLQKFLQSGPDLVCVEPFKHLITVREQYREDFPFLPPDALDRAEAILLAKYPEYARAAKEYLDGYTHYWYHSFIMKRALFMRYAPLLFYVLQELNNQYDLSRSSTSERRMLGYLSERIHGIFITQLKLENKTRIVTAPLAFIQNPEEFPLTPAFGPEAVNLVFLAREEQTPYLAAALASLAQCAADGHKYDVWIVEDELTPLSKQKLRACLPADTRFSLRFLPAPLGPEHWSQPPARRAQRLRCLLPSLFTNYDKMLYADTDVLFLKDPFELFQTPLTAPAAAAPDAQELCCRCKHRHNGQHTAEDFPAHTGVMLWDLKRMREEGLCEGLKARGEQNPASAREVFLQTLQGNWTPLSFAWNCQWNVDRLGPQANQWMEHAFFGDWAAACARPAVLHFCGPRKPARDVQDNQAWLFWRFLRQTPFYETMLFPPKPERPLSRASLRRKLLRYYLRLPFTFGRKNRHLRRRMFFLQRTLQFYSR